METVTSSAMSEIREMSANQLGLLLAKMFTFANRPQMKKLLPAFERRLFDVRGSIKDMRILVTFAQVFADLRHDSDHFWEFLTDIVASNFVGLSWAEKVELMRAFSRARRGSNELWGHFLFYASIEKGIDELERNIALTSFIAELEIPEEFCPKGKFDISQLASQIKTRLDSDPEFYVGSANCEDLAYLILFHPWTSAEEAQIFENLLRNSYNLMNMHSVNKINQLYQRVKKNQALKTIGIDDLTGQ